MLNAQVLAGRKTTGTIRGGIWVNGHEKVQDTFKRVCGYVEQFGALPLLSSVCIPSILMPLILDAVMGRSRKLYDGDPGHCYCTQSSTHPCGAADSNSLLHEH